VGHKGKKKLLIWAQGSLGMLREKGLQRGKLKRRKTGVGRDTMPIKARKNDCESESQKGVNHATEPGGGLAKNQRGESLKKGKRKIGGMSGRKRMG